MSDHRNDGLTKFKWAVVGTLVALVFILGTIENLVLPG